MTYFVAVFILCNPNKNAIVATYRKHLIDPWSLS